MPKVSVVVPVYNNEIYVRRCIDSLIGQTLDDIEIICVNDGSTDGSPAILHEYANRDARVTVIDKENSGYGVNINRGFACARGDYVGILESDDFAAPDLFERLWQMASKNDLDVARANFNLYWSKPEARTEFLELFKPEECGRVIDPLPRENQHCFYVQPAIWSAIYRRTFIEENRLTLLETPGAAYQDTAFNFKVWACARRVMFEHEALVNYRQDNEASSINNPGKTFTICGEYEEIERWLRDERPDLRNELAPVAAKMRFDAYTWNTGRLAPELREQFLERFVEDFEQLREEGLIDLTRFPADQQRLIKLLFEDPQAYLISIEKPQSNLSFAEMLRHKAATFAHYRDADGIAGIAKLLAHKVTGR